jgi:phage gp45-like
MLVENNLYSVSLKSSTAGAQTVFLKGSNNCNLTTTIQGYTGTTDVIKTSPVINPYGFLSIPDRAYTAVIGNMGIRSQQPFVIGYSNGVKSTSPISLVAGETGLYNSTSYSLELKLAEVRARFNSISCKLFNGNSDQKIFQDVITEILDMISYINLMVVVPYNVHIHGIAGTQTTVPTVLLTPYVPTGNLNTDQTYLNTDKCFIDDNGANL